MVVDLLVSVFVCVYVSYHLIVSSNFPSQEVPGSNPSEGIFFFLTLEVGGLNPAEASFFCFFFF